ncbi:hypothetical protein L209DRAFT_363283 [Thermothelomyces heterothallicus CBS 203.75]
MPLHGNARSRGMMPSWEARAVAVLLLVPDRAAFRRLRIGCVQQMPLFQSSTHPDRLSTKYLNPPTRTPSRRSGLPSLLLSWPAPAPATIAQIRNYTSADPFFAGVSRGVSPDLT